MKKMTTARAESTKRLALLRPILDERSEGRCDRCGWPFNVQDDGSSFFEIHHRLLRSRGGGTAEYETAATTMSVHPACHSVIHLEPANSTRQGWILPSGSDPEDCSLSLRGDAALLGADGSVTWLVEDTEDDPDTYRDLLIDDEMGTSA